MKNVLTIFKKEFYRVVSDRRLVFTAILLPGLAIYLMYSFMGNVISDVESDIEDHKMIVYTENMPTEFESFIDTNFDYEIEYHLLSDSTFSDVEQGIKDGEIDLLIRFEENFMVRLGAYEDVDYELPNIDTYYNPSERYSEYTLSTFNRLLGGFSSEQGFLRYGEPFFLFKTNDDNGNVPHVIEYENKSAGRGLAMLLPMLIVMFLFSGAMSIGPDSIAGEKERGTIATLLITPVKRSEIAIGKVLSLSMISLMSATSSFVGIMLSLNKLVGNSDVNAFEYYGVGDILMLFVVIFGTVLVIVGIVSVVSAYAKTIKEASMLILPFYFISIFLGISTMFSGDPSTDLITYIMPIYSSVHMIIAILIGEVSSTFFLVSVISNLVYVSVLIFVLNKLFQSEKVMFSK